MIGTLTLDQLRILVTVADTGSFSAAGRRLNRVQSAISQSIQTLETTKGVVLFDRSAKSPVLTEAGKALVSYARLVLDQAERFDNLSASIAKGIEPELSLAVDSMMPNQPVMDSLRGLMTEFPELPVSLYTEGMGASERRIMDQTAHLGIFPLIPQQRQDFVCEPLYKVTLIPVCAADHPLAAIEGPISREQFAPYAHLVLTDPIANNNPSFGVVGPKIWRFVDHGKRMDFLLNGFGWAKVPEHLAQPHLEAGRLIQLEITDLSITSPFVPLFAVHLRTRPPGHATRWLLNDLKHRCLTDHHQQSNFANWGLF